MYVCDIGSNNKTIANNRNKILMSYPSKTSVSSHSEIYYLNKNNLFYRYLKYLHLLKLQLNVNIPCSLFNRCLLKHCGGKTTFQMA